MRRQQIIPIDALNDLKRFFFRGAKKKIQYHAGRVGTPPRLVPVVKTPQKKTLPAEGRYERLAIRRMAIIAIRLIARRS